MRRDEEYSSDLTGVGANGGANAGWSYRRGQGGRPPRIGRRRRAPVARHLGQALTVLIAAFVVAAGSVVVLLGLSRVRSEAAVDVVQEQMAAIRAGRFEQAYSLFSRNYRAEISYAAFRRWLRDEPRLATVQRIEFRNRSVWGGTAILRGRFRDELGNNFSVQYLLVREDGVWRIDSMDLASEGREELPEAGPLHRI